MPTGLVHEVSLSREPDEREWGHIVSWLRRIFDTAGKRDDGPGVRHWWEGPLQATIEPSSDGVSLRLATRKADAPAVNIMGVLGVGMAGVLSLVGLATGQADLLVSAALSAGYGVLMFATNAIRLRTWSRRRRRQMIEVARRTRMLLAESEA